METDNHITEFHKNICQCVFSDCVQEQNVCEKCSDDRQVSFTSSLRIR